ncbi:MAG TPA: FtsQ-type POTRA domain-containing protein [Candidatus Sulfopaludibacter sp.]|jgi:cell division protein FtsQ|nr:FtsQ-type POTRA domain-containing protein [Candidatus Sulfopaludibacter sp.]
MARESKKAAASKPVRWRLWLGLLVGGAVFVSTAMAALKVRDFVRTDPQFNLSRYQKDSLTVDGVRYASRFKVQHAFAQDFEHSIFAVPLAERRRRLLAVDWVEDASISRIWPDRLVVRVKERTPVAFVYFRAGVLLIDGHGVLLEPPTAAGVSPHFAFPVLSGVREEEAESLREERVRAMLRLQEDLGYLAKDISEVNASDIENMRIIVKLENRAIELIMGDGNYGHRYQNFVRHYGEIAKQSPSVKVFDLRLDDRITAKE